MKKIGVFYAHRTRIPDQDLADELVILAALLKPRLEARFQDEVTLGVMPGKKDFERYFHGDWNEWTSSVALRRNVVTGRPLYDLFVCPDEFVGRATAHLLIAAMGAGKKVFRFNTYTKKLQTVAFIACIDDDNWSSGYQLITAQPTKETSHAQ